MKEKKNARIDALPSLCKTLCNFCLFGRQSFCTRGTLPVTCFHHQKKERLFTLDKQDTSLAERS